MVSKKQQNPQCQQQYHRHQSASKLEEQVVGPLNSSTYCSASSRIQTLKYSSSSDMVFLRRSTRFNFVTGADSYFEEGTIDVAGATSLVY
ncbi:hypothetical protein WN943_014239 [Citrus x changshan-huyou]